MSNEDIKHYAVAIQTKQEVDKSYTQGIFISKVSEDGSLPEAPDEAILVQQQENGEMNERSIEGLAQVFYQLYKDEVEKNSPQEEEQSQIIQSTQMPVVPVKPVDFTT